MHYIIKTREETYHRFNNHFKAWRHAIMNRCVLYQFDEFGVKVELNDFTKL